MSLFPPFTYGRPAGSSDLLSLVDKYETPMGQYLGQKLDQGWWNSFPGQALARSRLPQGALTQLDPLTVMGKEEESRERMRAEMAGEMEPAPGQPYNAELEAELDRRGIAYLTEDAWKAGPYYREKMPFEPFMTEARARAKADVYDQNAYRDWLIERRQNGVLGSVLGFGAALVGSLPDPVNFVALGWAGKAIVSARATGAGAGSIAKAFGVGAAEAGALTAAAEPFLAANLRFWGDELTWEEAILDIALGAAIGGSFSGIGRAVSLGREARVTARAEQEAALRVDEDLFSRRTMQIEALGRFDPNLNNQTVGRALDDLNLAMGDMVANRPVRAASDGLVYESGRAGRETVVRAPGQMMEPEAAAPSLGSLAEQAYQNPKFEGRWTLGKVTAQAATIINRILDRARSPLGMKRLEIGEATITADAMELRKNWLAHVVNENDPRSAPLSKGDFDLIPEILRNPDSVGVTKAGGAARSASLEYRKRISAEYVAVLDVQPRRGALGLKSFYKLKDDGGSPGRGTMPPGGGPAAQRPSPGSGYPARRQDATTPNVGATDAPVNSMPEARVLDEVQTPEPDALSPEAVENDLDLQAYREQEAADGVTPEEKQAFEAAEREVKRMDDIEQAFQAAQACITRAG